MKYILDTDIGDDIDDAFALDLALKRNLDLLFITTVYRNTRERAQIAKKMLALYGKSLPVYAGNGSTVLRTENTERRLCQWTEDLKDYSPDGGEGEAIDAIVAAARAYKKELTILAIGPLSNIARAILKDPEAMRSIGGLVFMGGDYARHYAAWNIRCDVEAAKIVYDSGVKITAFGSELTSSVELSGEEQERVFSMKQDAYHAYLAELSRLWYKSKREGTKIQLHDLLIVEYAFDPSFVETRHIPVVLETKGAVTRGITVDLSGMEGLTEKGRMIEIARSVDVRRFINYFFERIGVSAE